MKPAHSCPCWRRAGPVAATCRGRQGADGDLGETGRRVARLGSLADRPEDLSSPQRHTFRVPPNPEAGFDGIIVHCEVLECEPPSRLAYSWSAGSIVDTQVSYRLEPEGDGTRVFFEHSGFDMSQPWGEQAFREAEFGWVKMLERLPTPGHGCEQQPRERS